jgi:hypothetical protein
MYVYAIGDEDEEEDDIGIPRIGTLPSGRTGNL